MDFTNFLFLIAGIAVIASVLLYGWGFKEIAKDQVAEAFIKGANFGRANVLAQIKSLGQAVISYDPKSDVEWAVLDYLDRSMSTNRGFAFNELLLRTSEIKARAEKERQRAMDQAIKEAVKKQTMPMYTETTTTTVKPKKRKAKKTAVNPKNK